MFGIGIDILDMQWIRNTNANPDDPFFIKSFSEKERKEAVSHPDPVAYFSTRFAGKEAVIKCIGICESIRLADIVILCDENGRPAVELAGAVRTLAESKGIKNIFISLSCNGHYAAASAIAES